MGIKHGKEKPVTLLTTLGSSGKVGNENSSFWKRDRGVEMGFEMVMKYLSTEVQLESRAIYLCETEWRFMRKLEILSTEEPRKLEQTSQRGSRGRGKRQRH